MLKLKKLQILGFKSFSDRTELKFHGDGIAAIVGPNGCGKSNISDAISWVLGEQSAKSLRGARMEDVIFAGTRDRKPMGMAEVSLTLIDPEVYPGGDASIEEPEIEIRDEMPEDDWDEASLRAEASEDAEHHMEEVQPGHAEEVAAAETQTAQAAAEGTPVTSESAIETSATEASATPADPGVANPGAAAPAPLVVLRIRRRKFKPLTFRKGEIVVTRRLFRSGDSEYLLNGKLCRLRDIQDIFMGTGLGPESYAIIEQGRIGQILSSKPTDRRAIIEEAAGITKFKTRKRLAEARLEESKLNLARINDIFEEVTRQMNSLKRQAAKAERYARLRDEMRAKLRLVLASRFVQMGREKTELDEQLTALAGQMQRQSEGVQQKEAEQGERTQRGYAIEGDLRQNRERIATLIREADRASAQQRYNEERCQELLARCQAAAAELEQIAGREAALEAERESHRQLLDSAVEEVTAAQAEAARAQNEAAAVTTALAQLEQRQEQDRQSIVEAVAAAADVRNHITQSQENLAGLDREARRLQSEIASANSQIEAFGGQRGQLALEFETASYGVAALGEQIAAGRQRLQEKRSAEGECKNRLDTLRAEFATLLGRRGSLEAVIAEHGYSTESVRRLFQSGVMHSGLAPVGVLADFLEVEDRYEHVVEDFLRDELNYVVVKSWDAADEGLRLLRSDVDGRATFLVHPGDSQAKFSFIMEDKADPAPRRDSIVPLKNCIRVLNGFGKSLEVILPKLGHGYIAPDASLARELALSNPDAFFLSQSGECFHNVTVTGGKQRSEGPLSLKRELREVLKQLTEVEDALRREEQSAALLFREIADLNSLIERLESEKREGEKLAMTSGHGLKQLEAELHRAQERWHTYENEMSRVITARQERLEGIAERQEVLAACDQRRLELESALASAQASLGGLRTSRETAVQVASEMMARLAGLEERRRAAAASLERSESLVAELVERMNGLRVQRAAALQEQQQREAENALLAGQLVNLGSERQAAETRELTLEAESEQVRARLAQIEEELRSARHELDAARDHRGELSARLAKLESDHQHMVETASNELGITAEELLADDTLLPVAGEQLEAEDTAYRDMRSRLEAMGPVNMMALEEYKETAQRHEFLVAQRKDLYDAIENTQNAIKEIETVSKQKFQEAFDRINENFQATFRKLFGGGQAFMRLTDVENAMESGIDVVASPPGKKLQNVLLLSGGEKALTALALLVGIFQYQPSPFCILDEVDAPLDEANVGRFNELVKSMSGETQFVLITHSKKTMSIAPVLYGVTMQEPGVSKLVSVRFGQEEMQAATA